MFSLSLVGTVLHLRGSKTPQPLEDEYGNILLWNGEIFGGIEVYVFRFIYTRQKQINVHAGKFHLSQPNFKFISLFPRL